MKKTKRKIFQIVNMFNLMSLLIFNQIVQAQNAYVLEKVMHDRAVYSNYVTQVPDYIYADSRGGKAIFSVDYGNSCIEKYEITWQFKRSIQTLYANEQIPVDLQVRLLSGSCSDQNSIYARVEGASTYWSRVIKFKNIKMAPYHATQGTGIVAANKPTIRLANYIARGYQRGYVKMNNLKNLRFGDRTAIRVSIYHNFGGYGGPAKEKRPDYEILYLYKASNAGTAQNGGGIDRNRNPDLTGTWYLNGDRNSKRFIRQNGNYLTFFYANYRSSGYFKEDDMVFASAWNATGRLSSGGNILQWNNQTWTRYAY